jgi:uncharacterized protein
MILYKQFSVDGDDFVYDTASNAIVQLPDGAGRWIDGLVAAGAEPLLDRDPARVAAAAFVKRARVGSGLFADRPARNYRGILAEERVRACLGRGMRGLLLETTTRCNQRCSYCVYSGSYEGHRAHGSERMSWNVARKSIDFFAAHAADTAPVYITFYGGEPLLAWDLVRRCVDYARGLHIPGLILLLNTNLTLLDEAKAAFLVENGVALAVSLDGPAFVHDAFRRFPSGRPTHARVIRWLAYLWENHRSYWDRSVVLHSTLDMGFDVEAVFDYFCDEKWRGLSNTIGGIRDDGAHRRRVSREARLRHQASLDRILARYAEAVTSGEPFPYSLLRSVFGTVFRDLPARQIGYPPPEAHPMRTCIPGATRLYVDTQGVFYPCEKCEVAAARIGDIEHGIEVGKVRRLLERQVRFCESDCVQCWASRLCRLCLTHFLEGSRIRRSAVRRKCRQERDRIHRSLERFTRLYTEEPPSAWAHPFSLHRAVADARRKSGES